MIITYYCKKCNSIIGILNSNQYLENYCFKTISEKYDSIYLLDCFECSKFVGILCVDICIICFGKYLILGEKNLFKWFCEYKKTLYKSPCKHNNKKKFREQHWFFNELSFII